MTPTFTELVSRSLAEWPARWRERYAADFPEPEIMCRVAKPDEIPASAKRYVRELRGRGYEVIVTIARGYFPAPLRKDDPDAPKFKLMTSHAVRALRLPDSPLGDGRRSYRVALLLDGQWGGGWGEDDEVGRFRLRLAKHFFASIEPGWRRESER